MSRPSSSSPAELSQQPVTRSRTLFYLSIRDSITPTHNRGRIKTGQYGDTLDIADNEEEERLIEGTGRGKGLPPKWCAFDIVNRRIGELLIRRVDISDEVEEILGRVGNKVAVLDKLHAKHVLPGFTDRSAEEREIERQTQDITRDFRKCTTLISAIRPAPRSTRVEITTAKNVQRGLAQKIQDTSGMFRKKQRVYMQKLQGHAIKNKDLLAASGAIPIKGAEQFDELQEDVQASQSQLQSQAQTGSNLDIETRSREITQIATSISELADLFRDLGNLVVEQGTVLDSVEYNVSTTARELGAAVEELKVAQKYQSNAGRRKCILFLVLCIVGLVIVLVYKPRSSGSEIGPDPIPPESDSGIVLDPLPEIPPRPGLEDGSEVEAGGDGWTDEKIPIGDDDLRRSRHLNSWAYVS